MDSAAFAALKLLLILLTEQKEASQRVAELGALPLLVDLVGPPPKAVLAAEKAQHPALLDPEWQRAQAAARCASVCVL
jgi:hypothetical protein